MTDTVSWILELKVNDGQLDAAKALMAEMVAATQADEPGALAYEWFATDDTTEIHIYERYADSAEVMTHMGNFGAKFGERFMGVFTPARLRIYGTPNAEVVETMAALGPVHLSQIGGFAR